MNMKTSQPDAPQAIAPSEKERQARVYSPRNLQRVLGGLHRDGLVVLKDVIDVKHIDALDEAMCADAERWVADPEQEFNHNVKCEIRPVTFLLRLFLQCQQQISLLRHRTQERCWC